MLSVAVIFLSFAPASTDKFAQWDKKDLEKANTGKDDVSLSAEEKAVLFYMNLARINPPLFEATILKFYTDSVNYKGSAYLKKAQDDLNSTSKMGVLLPSDEVTKIAADYAEKSGKSGSKGHQGFEERYTKEVKKKYSGWVGENCYYGLGNALKTVCTLIIDEGVGDSGHRKNILNANFKFAGIAIRSHKTAKSTCVISFLGEVKEKK
jgi:uncharacterized protein YkwD